MFSESFSETQSGFIFFEKEKVVEVVSPEDAVLSSSEAEAVGGSASEPVILIHSLTPRE